MEFLAFTLGFIISQSPEQTTSPFEDNFPFPLTSKIWKYASVTPDLSSSQVIIVSSASYWTTLGDVWSPEASQTSFPPSSHSVFMFPSIALILCANKSKSLFLSSLQTMTASPDPPVFRLGVDRLDWNVTIGVPTSGCKTPLFERWVA